MKKRAFLATTLLLAGTGWADAQVMGKRTPPPAEPATLAVAPAGFDAPSAPPAGAAAPAPSLLAQPPTRVNADGDLVPCPEPSGYAFWSGDRCWFQADYLLWWVKQGPNNVPLLTTGQDFQDTPGSLGEAGTQVMYGGSAINYSTFSGMQLTAGAWLNDQQTYGLELRAFLLEQHNKGARFSSDDLGNPFLLRPFFNDQTDAEDVAIIAFPDLIRGQIHFANETKTWGTEANVFCGWLRGASGRVDAIVGFRYLQLNEKLRIDEQYNPLDLEDNDINFGGQGFAFPNFVQVFDQFKTRNQFYGGQIGARAELNFGRVFVNARGQIALGTTHSTSIVSGGSYLIDGATGAEVASLSGGVLAQNSNIGKRTSNSFGVVPSVELTVGCNVTDSIRLHAGYNFIYWSNVLRPGDQIDRFIDPQQVPTFQEYDAAFVGKRPRQALKGADFWAQGLSFGAEFRY